MGEYVCYLLQSTPKPQSFYIGCTYDPIHRLRQHNGELVMGAKRTKDDSKRPWKIICIVSGFPSRAAALQFESAWQHPYRSRHISTEDRISKTLSQSHSLVKRLGNLRLLLGAPVFARLSLTVHLLSSDCQSLWLLNKYRIAVPAHVHTSEEFDNKMPRQGPHRACCPKCGQSLDPLKLAQEWLEPHPGELLPVSGLCPKCYGFILWHQVAPRSKRTLETPTSL